MVLRVNSALGGRVCDGRPPVLPGGPAITPARRRAVPLPRLVSRSTSRKGLAIPAWLIGGYRAANAGDLASAIAFNGLIALVPTFLLLVAVAGLFLQEERVMSTAVMASLWALPPNEAREALQAVLAARTNSGWLGVFSLVGFAWIGTNVVSCLARCMNRIYGVANCGFVCERQRGFFVVIAFATLFGFAAIAATVPTLFVRQSLSQYFQTWALASGWVQVFGYVVALLAAVTLFLVLYRVVPNAGQRLLDVWPGSLTAAVLFVTMAQAFPIYIRVAGEYNRLGAGFGFVSLLVGWFYVLAHVLLFGTYVNATYQAKRRRRRRLKRTPQPALNPSARQA